MEVPDDGEAAREEQKCGNNYNPYKTSLFAEVHWRVFTSKQTVIETSE